jgi:hypothetical protein
MSELIPNPSEPSASKEDTETRKKKHQWLHFFRDEFDKESDRAAVILTASMLDETLKDLLESHLIPCSSSDDPLFDGSNAPMGTFSARIECAYRLGLISKNFAKCLHITRKIRNAFAHDVAGCTFSSQSVAARVRALKQATNAPDKTGKDNLHDPRTCFCYVTGYFMWCIKAKMEKLSQISESEAICCRFSNEKES